LPNQYLLL